MPIKRNNEGKNNQVKRDPDYKPFYVIRKIIFCEAIE